LAFVV